MHIRRESFKAALKCDELISFLSLESKMEDLLSARLMAMLDKHKMKEKTSFAPI